MEDDKIHRKWEGKVENADKLKTENKEKCLNDKRDSREVKDSNVSIMEKWNSNGYKEEGDTETESPRAKLKQKSLHKCDFANASYFFNIIINRSQISQRQFWLKH